MTTDRGPLLVAYVDGELDAAKTAEVELLLATDAQARRIVEAYRETASLLRAACSEGFYAPAAAAAAATVAAPRPGRRSIGQVAWLVAASVVAGVIGFGGGVFWATGRQSEEHAGLLDEIARYQKVYSRETVHLVEVPAAQLDHLKTWLGNRMDQHLVVPDLSAAGLRFAGGRMLVSGDKPMAQLMYTRDGGAPVALCIARMVGPPAPVRVEERSGLRLAIWQDGRFAYVLVGDLDSAEARRIAEAAEAQIQG